MQTRLSIPVLITGILLIVSSYTYAQEFIGLRMDNYAGSNSMMMNPALPGSSLLPYDINLLAAGVSIDNNYAYMAQQSILGLYGAETFEADFYNPEKLKAFGNVLIQGPSAFTKLDEFTVGLFLAGRSAGFVLSDEKAEGFKELSDIQNGVNYNVPTFRSGVANWFEIGLNGEMLLKESKTGILNAGINAKLLLGYDAYTGQGNAPFSFVRYDDVTMVSNFDYTYAYTKNLGSNRMTDITNYEVNGFGTAIDLGFTYNVKSKLTKHRNTGYDIKFGVSAVDLGFIRFKQNAGTYDLFTNTEFTALNSDIDSISDLDEFTKVASKIIYDNGRASKTGSSFSIFTPGAFIFFADKNIGKGVFVNLLAVQRLSFIHKDMIARANMIAITPRFEKAKFAVSVPVVLVEDADVHLGTAIRFLFFTLGSDDILSVFTPGNLDGTDFYFAIKFSPYWLQNNLSGGFQYKSNKRKQVKCPTMN